MISWRRVLGATVIIVCVGLLGYKTYTNWGALKSYDWKIAYRYLIPSALLFAVQMLMIVWGWQSIMNCLAKRLSFRHHYKVYAFTHLMHRIPAGVLWVVAGRAYAYRDHNVPARTSALGSFLELLLVVLTALPLAALAAFRLEYVSPAVAALLIAAALALTVAGLHPRVIGKLYQIVHRETFQAELTYRNTFAWALIYAIIWLISGTGLYLTILLFTDLPLADLPVVIGAWVLSSLIAYATLLTPSGFGVKELSLALLLSGILADPLPLVVALAVRILWTIYDIGAALVAAVL
jgi:hypothetical protein